MSAANGHDLPPGIPPHHRRIGLLRQDPGLFPHLTVRENLLYARYARAAELEAVAKDLGSREVQGLLRVLSSPRLLAQLASIPGYDPSACGESRSSNP